MLITILPFSSGSLFLAKDQMGLCFVQVVQNQKDIRRAEEMLKNSGYSLQKAPEAFRKEQILFESYFSGQRADFSQVPFHFIKGTPYQQAIWSQTAKIPYGQTETYKSLSQKMNHRGFRSAGQALSKNPLLIVVPCHRVLSERGLGGFSAGLPLKKFLLELEGIPFPS
jgi:methylated-DNA-[protein]-cysteine S-methyltransferase